MISYCALGDDGIGEYGFRLVGGCCGKGFCLEMYVEGVNGFSFEMVPLRQLGLRNVEMGILE